MSNREQAYEDYKKGLKYKEISEKYGVSINTVKSWAARYWRSEKAAASDEKVATKTQKGCNQNNKKLQPKKSRGGQVGNKNAEGNSGGGAPVENTNAVKNAKYAEIYWEFVSEDEKAMIDETPDDEELHLLNTLNLVTIRERRQMQRLARYQELLEKSSDGLILKEDLKTLTEEYNASGKLSKKTKEGTKTKVDAMEQIQIIESELTRIQKVKLNAIRELAQLRGERLKATEGKSPDDIIADELHEIFGGGKYADKKTKGSS